MARKCTEYLSNLSDYLDGELDEGLCEELENHLRGCNNCRIMVDTLKQTVSLCRDGQPEKLPPSLENKLNNLLRKRWHQKFGK